MTDQTNVAKQYTVILHTGAEDSHGFETDDLKEAEEMVANVLTDMAAGAGFRVLLMGTKSYVIPVAKINVVEVRGFDITEIVHRVEESGFSVGGLVGEVVEGRHEE